MPSLLRFDNRPPSLTTREAAARILFETLKLSKNTETVEVDKLAANAGVSKEIVVSVLSEMFRPTVYPNVTVSPQDRFKIAMLAAENGWLDSTAIGLSWQEFEHFAEECLRLAGFEANRNVRIKDAKRSWQIDVVGTKSTLVLSIDCKHWKPPNYPSKFKQASAHQKAATMKLLARNYPGAKGVVGLPVILTLHDPNSVNVDGVVMLPIQKLPDFLSHITPFTPGLPFLYPKEDPVQNPIIAVPLPSGD